MNLFDRYADMILAIGAHTGLDDSMLHVHAGMAILILARLITGRGLSKPLPLMTVIVLEAANELADRVHYGTWRIEDTVSDILYTLFWPTALFLALRFAERGPRLSADPPEEPQNASASAGEASA